MPDSAMPPTAADPAPQLAVRSPLPRPLTSFIGREGELEEIEALLARDDVQLVTLTGPGGVGKTRVALQLAARQRGQGAAVVYVPLSTVRDRDLVFPAIARSLGLHAGARERVAAQLIGALAGTHMLLVLDNVEQVADAAPDLAELLQACPNLTLLITSRVRLRLSGERIYALFPLPVPDDRQSVDLAALADLGAVRLFVARGQATNADFALTERNATAVSGICRRLDGLPLALELAAAKLPVLAPADLLARLEHRLAILTGGGRDLPDRQQTIRATIAWSHDLLSPGEQRFFRQMAVFIGGFTLAAAESVCAAASDGFSAIAGITALTDYSLVRLQPGDAVRYVMLETVREFALEQLAASGEEETVRAAHAHALLDLARAELPHTHKNESVEPIARLNAEIGNIRAALAWLAETGRTDELTALVTQLRWFWYLAYPPEGLRWFEHLLALPVGNEDPLLREIEFWVGKLAGRTDPESAEARSHLQRARALAQAAGDAVWEAEATFILGCAAEDAGEAPEADALLRAARELFAGLGNRRNVASTTYHLGIVACGRGDVTAAQELLTEARTMAATFDNWVLSAWCAGYLALIACDQGQPARAAGLLREYHGRIDPAIGQVQVWAMHFLAAAVLAARIGETDAAARLFGAMTTASQSDPRAWPESVVGDRVVASVRARLGDAAYDAAASAGQRMPVAEALAEIDALLAAVERLPAPAPKLPITVREQDVLRLLVEGKSDREIAAALYLSHRTVGNHVLHILTKLNVESRTAAATYAVRHGLV